MTLTTTDAAHTAARQAAEHVLTLDCEESPGIVSAVSGFLAGHGCDIIENKQFDDWRARHFFMRVHVASEGGSSDIDTLRKAFEPIGEKFEMRWKLERRDTKPRIVIMVSKSGHCLADLLYRSRIGELSAEIVAVVSNHRNQQELTEWHGVPFHHIPVTKDTKPEAEARLESLLDDLDVELVVLARYMQVLSDELSARLSGKCINIHHSFLPAFKGAKPYHQAYERGVKMVGATAHYITADLDEGPIIAQQVIDVDHTYGPEDLVAIGRDAEVAALTRAVRWHCDGRVFAAGSRTVVLR
ncbi:formyltetrahydrofolate deformylase [Spelaeicoccus albus]|uniref:Formyltetrahydrofolate deformylase n=1 Tax=Spelaeicoccus albus TaxID=1280376 RepID=A0A7Z0AA21_9MICO|nr:formyltetrahydrofolate deformylase [Spelaeicoccus albus]NYI67192.1 formyltetrahydrofolate deformylase [Spelaeicoccus albus]